MDCRVASLLAMTKQKRRLNEPPFSFVKLKQTYSAASFDVGAALRTFSSTWLSKLTKFLRNISRRCFAVAANSDLEAQVFTGSRMCGSTPGTETGTARPK